MERSFIYIYTFGAHKHVNMTTRVGIQDLLGCTVGGETQSASSVSAAGSDILSKLFPFGGWRHWGDKGVDDWEAVGRDAA